MAVITQTQGVKTASVPVNATVRALSASDTLTYVPGAGQTLELANTTGSIVTVTLTGSAPDTTVPVSGYGSVSAAGGKAVAVPANGWTVVPLDAIAHYLAGTGTVTVTGGTGVNAILYV